MEQTVSANNQLTILSDKPTKEDRLNFRDYADLLADIVCVCETPMTIGILGEWGSGKTSLMLMIDERLRQVGISTIWFNAWKYDKEGSLWRALILKILEGLKADEKDTEEIRRKLYSAVTTEELGKIEIDWLEAGKAIAKQSIKAAATIALPILGIDMVLAKLRETLSGEASLDELSKVISRHTIKVSQDRIASIEEFQQLYSQLLYQSLGQERRLVVFIDDLDRCFPIRALEVFEAVKTFLDAEGCVYLVGCDQRLIHQGLQEKYGKTGGIDIEDYLEKILQLSFEIPPVRTEDAQEFVSQLGLGVELQPLVGIMTAGLENNPRKLKRFLNNLEIQRRLVSARRLGIKQDVLVKLSCITHGWKHVWAQVMENPTLLSELQKYAVDEELATKVGEKPWIQEILDHENRLVGFLRQAPQISDADLDEYIFLAKATYATVSEPRPFEKIPNPYLVGLPISSPEMFFGRENEITSIMEHLSNPGISLIVLLGQRRVGKTSLLLQIGRFLSESFVSVSIDMQGLFPGSEEILLYQFARHVSRAMTTRSYEPPTLDRSGETLSFGEFDHFIADVVARLSGKRLVLMIDEFEVIEERISQGYLSDLFLAHLRYLLQKHSSLAMILSGVHRIEELSRTYWSPFFNLGLTMKVGYLTRADAAALITEPIRGFIEYRGDAINEIIDLAGGHPFLVQLICYSLVNSLNKEMRNIATREDVDKVLRDVLESGQAYLQYIWALSDETERILLSLLAMSLTQEADVITLNNVLTELRQYSIPLEEQDILRALSSLCAREILVKKPIDNKEAFDFAVPLIAHWICASKPFEQVAKAAK